MLAPAPLNPLLRFLLFSFRLAHLPAFDTREMVSSWRDCAWVLLVHALQFATFTMVARDPVTRAAYPVNKLKATTPEEEKILAEGEDNKRMRKVCSFGGGVRKKGRWRLFG